MAPPSCTWALSTLALAIYCGLSAAEPGVVSLKFSKREITNPEDYALKLRRRASTAQATIYNAEGNVLYLVNTTVGTPPQDLALQLDTGSSDIWIPSASSLICTSASNRCSNGAYNSSASSTFEDVLRNKFSISYVDGTQIGGDYINETFGIAGVTIKQMTMGLADQAQEPNADDTTPFQGIVGVGFDAGEAIVAQTDGQYGYPNVISQMKLQGIISTRAYSLWLNDLESPEGNILFGGIDNDKFEGDLTILPLQSDSQTGAIDSFTVTFAGLNITGAGGKTVYTAQTTTPVILDSGTTLTYLPDDIANAIAQGVGAVNNYDYGVVVPCDLASTAGQFLFQFGNTDNGPIIKAEISQFVLPFPSDIVSPKFRNGKTACRWGIQGSGQDPNLFGDTFLRSAYVVYNIDGNQVGIAQTTFNSTSQDIKQITAVSSLPGASSTASGSAQQTRTGPIYNTDGFGGVLGGASTAVATAGTGTFDLGTASSTGSSGSSTSSSSSTKGAASTVHPPSTPFVGAIAAGVSVLFALVGGSMLILL
ncbi:uncharacterized protein PV09_07983 [Verruconis gallopava]|uniref:Peptidase A1 domain-containing protein n=1 Tax=Verruconis gallopava TaxID=253628 RepID=A0A0D2A1C4_9PEZI|nr:uncharacterized protein PV09_07983 [Verruconis gallopava]KIW00458.1 hypothetical protein PV09_07983 [Verruconis gallopava]